MASTPSPARTAAGSFAKVLGLAVLVIGLAFLFVGVTRGSEGRALARNGLVVQGTVTEKRIDHVSRHKKAGGNDERTLYVVQYRFSTRLGAVLDGEQAVGESLWRGLRKDGPIAVRYLEANPFINRTDAESDASADIFLVAGGVLAAGGLTFLVALIREKRKTMRTGQEPK
jgi:hypothetical protein